MSNTPIVRGRFAPTPSGRMHLGNVFAALLAWLSAKASGGTIVLRIEDLDPRAQHPEAADQLMDDLIWLGLEWDEGPYYQSRRTAIYLDALKKLSAQGLTYPCFCTRAELHAATAPHATDGTYVYQGTCRNLSEQEVARLRRVRPPATRLKVPPAQDPDGIITFSDLAWGEQHEVLSCDCGDFLVRRSDGVVAYQLAVVVDDALMGVTQVVRGRDLLASSARQIYVARLLGYPAPQFGHVPLLVAPDKRRLSKRDHDLDLGVLREQGVHPERIVGALAALIGIGDPGQCATPADLIDAFSWEALAAHRDDVVIDEAFITQLYT